MTRNSRFQPDDTDVIHTLAANRLDRDVVVYGDDSRRMGRLLAIVRPGS